MVGGYKTAGSMRLANRNNPFDEREARSGLRSPKSRYIIFAEGAETEKLYFTSLSRSKRKKENIMIEYMDRWKDNSGRSNQLSVVKDVIEYVENVKNGKINVNSLKNLFDQLVENLKIEELPAITDQLNRLAKNNPDLFAPNESMQAQLFSCLTVKEFDSEYDKIFIILDRDRHSFTKEQFDEVLVKSKSNNLNLGITNPCFEFFLLLHFKEIISVLDHDNLEKLKNNPKSGKKTYVEQLLSNYLFQYTNRSFKKNNYDTNFFIERIDVALANAKQFEINNEKLEDELGSSIINILKEIID
ncbi:RloB family protein [Streptococcus gallolyticus]|uniref:RloB family protein n=1 Tax=Streptococcus gallolyticus TaxID=315405 RepID=UPI00228386E2|nr:RloB family protein [Streptococcus gallolyticus]MCY7165709.1 RloB family protein [Streptococcus gallolyticus subsp. gallolyticus]MCY7182806.1 RloB family protein [Streptococcus gallolyticus subsp. gallolyticus]